MGNLKWVCSKCHDNLGGEYEILTIPNYSKKPCIYCSEIADCLLTLKFELTQIKMIAPQRGKVCQTK